MIPPEHCERPNCDNPAMVGWGKVTIWLCLYHFEEALAETKRRIDQLRQIPSAPSPSD
jgi:hypothetical protein